MLAKQLSIFLENKSGRLTEVTECLGQNGINLEYMYAFLTRKTDKAFMVLRVADNDQAIKILTEAGINPLCAEDIVKLF